MDACKTEQKSVKWYNNPMFPLIPEFKYCPPEDDWHTVSWNFNWLGVRLWSLDHFSFELSFHIDCHWGIAIGAILPYTRIIVGIPCPRSVERWVNTHLVRKSKALKQMEQNNPA